MRFLVVFKKIARAPGLIALAVPVSAAAQTEDLPSSAQQASPPDRQGDTNHLPVAGLAEADPTVTPSAIAANGDQPPPPGLIPAWAALRTRLAQQGIGVVASYSSESAYNVTGGRQHLFREAGQVAVGALIDLNRTVGLKGAAFQATLTLNRGDNLSDDARLGTLQQVQNIYGRGQTLRVTQFWYEQAIGPRTEIKLGLTSPGEDFADFTCEFMNLSFCGAQPGNLVGDYWGNWTVSQMGARVRFSLSSTGHVAAGVYQVNPRNLFARRFYFVNIAGGTGVLVPAELGFVGTDERGHVASTRLGGWFTNAVANDVLTGVDGRPYVTTGLAPIPRSSRYGVYASLQRQITGRSRNGTSLDGLTLFASVTQTDRATATIDNQVIVGAFYTGLFAAVPASALGLAAGRTNVNGRVTRSQLLDPSRQQLQSGGEYALELYFSFKPIAGLEVRPDIQWVLHPGGVRGSKNIGVLGLKTSFTL